MNENIRVYDLLRGIIGNLKELEKDALKHEKGNKAAGARLRKGLLQAKADAQNLRVRVLEDQKNDWPKVKEDRCYEIEKFLSFL